jgi:hypothetical protein
MERSLPRPGGSVPMRGECHDRQGGLRRVVVIGCAGAGKSTFSEALARCLGVPHVDRDTLGEIRSDAYQGAVAAAVGTEGWVFDGAPHCVEETVYPACQLVIWLDYPRPLVVWRATRRSLRRTFGPLPPGENGWWRLRQWITPGGPRCAWCVYRDRKRRFSKLEQRPDLAGKVLRFGEPAAARAWLASLSLPLP